MEDFLRLVRKVEAAHPEWSGEDVLNALRGNGGYDSPHFQTLFGTAPAPALSPAGELTDADIQALRRMTGHTVDQNGESGLVRDKLGNDVAMGHVLTGLSAGQHYDPEKNLSGPFHALGLGENVDNLLAATLSGDLGQSATLKAEGGTAPLTGAGSEATDAELVGDVDGYLLGGALRDAHQRGENPLGTGKLSDMLAAYYSDPGPFPEGLSCGNRFESMSEVLPAQKLEEETQSFAATYGYRNHSLTAPLTDADDESSAAVKEFGTWLEKNKRKEQFRRAVDQPTGMDRFA